MSDDITTLVDRLLRATKNRKVSWTVASEGVFLWSGPNASVTLGADLERDSEILIAVLNDDGSVVESGAYGYRNDIYEQIAELYESARRNALGADQVISSLIGELDRVDPNPPSGWGKSKASGWGNAPEEPPF